MEPLLSRYYTPEIMQIMQHVRFFCINGSNSNTEAKLAQIEKCKGLFDAFFREGVILENLDDLRNQSIAKILGLVDSKLKLRFEGLFAKAVQRPKKKISEVAAKLENGGERKKRKVERVIEAPNLRILPDVSQKGRKDDQIPVTLIQGNCSDEELEQLIEAETRKKDPVIQGELKVIYEKVLDLSDEIDAGNLQAAVSQCDKERATVLIFDRLVELLPDEDTVALVAELMRDERQYALIIDVMDNCFQF